MTGEYKTSQEWLELNKDKVYILDHDGWDRRNFNYSFYEERITEKEFEQRLARSTIQWNVSKL